MKFQVNNFNYDIVDWLSENVGLLRSDWNLTEHTPPCGTGWRMTLEPSDNVKFFQATNIKTKLMLEIDDDKLSLLYKLRWIS
jgi:hypothetical protein